MITQEKYYQIALLEVDGIGPKIAKKLIEHFGSAEAVLQQDRSAYNELNTVGQNIQNALQKKHIFKIAEQELNYCEKNNISVISYKESAFPYRLNECDDAPIILYYKGNAHLNAPKIISIVGTRKNTNYGRKICNELIESLSPQNILVISGLAYGIDIIAHQKALDLQLDSIAVLAHGLDRIYPRSHKYMADKLLHQGGWLTEYKSNTNPDRENFPKRNRIVAGLSDATVVIESAIKGGSMITAQIANSYNRDVFAVPGKLEDPCSAGCNHLIKTNRANLLQSGNDIAYILGWDSKPAKPKSIQNQLFPDLSSTERKIVDMLSIQPKSNIDEITHYLDLPTNTVSTELLMMEFKKIVFQVPGKKYVLV